MHLLCFNTSIFQDRVSTDFSGSLGHRLYRLFQCKPMQQILHFHLFYCPRNLDPTHVLFQNESDNFITSYVWLGALVTSLFALIQYMARQRTVEQQGHCTSEFPETVHDSWSHCVYCCEADRMGLWGSSLSFVHFYSVSVPAQFILFRSSPTFRVCLFFFLN